MGHTQGSQGMSETHPATGKHPWRVPRVIGHGESSDRLSEVMGNLASEVAQLGYYSIPAVESARSFAELSMSDLGDWLLRAGRRLPHGLSPVERPRRAGRRLPHGLSPSELVRDASRWLGESLTCHGSPVGGPKGPQMPLWPFVRILSTYGLIKKRHLYM